MFGVNCLLFTCCYFVVWGVGTFAVFGLWCCFSLFMVLCCGTYGLDLLVLILVDLVWWICNSVG